MARNRAPPLFIAVDRLEGGSQQGGHLALCFPKPLAEPDKFLSLHSPPLRSAGLQEAHPPQGSRCAVPKLSPSMEMNVNSLVRTDLYTGQANNAFLGIVGDQPTLPINIEGTRRTDRHTCGATRAAVFLVLDLLLFCISSVVLRFREIPVRFHGAYQCDPGDPQDSLFRLKIDRISAEPAANRRNRQVG